MALRKLRPDEDTESSLQATAGNPPGASRPSTKIESPTVHQAHSTSRRIGSSHEAQAPRFSSCTGSPSSDPDSQHSTIHTFNPWQEGLNRRNNLRQVSRSAMKSFPAKDPHHFVPHASSGRSAHRGRGGFPGLLDIIGAFTGITMPKLHAFLRQQEHEVLHSPHPMQYIADALEAPFKRQKDDAEKREARHARWLPPGVRTMVVGRNSQFFEEEVSDEELELLGALEWKATRLLTWVLIAVSSAIGLLTPASIVLDLSSYCHYCNLLFKGPRMGQRVCR